MGPMSFQVAEEAMIDLVSNLEETDELDTIDELNSTFANFTAILKDRPLGNATTAEAQSFLNVRACLTLRLLEKTELCGIYVSLWCKIATLAY